MFILKVKDGFSLIELLVVIAIIGILAAVGTIGYSNYIESSKQKSLLANFAGIERLATTNLELDGGIQTKSCIDYVKDIVKDNASKKLYNSNVDIYVNGNCDSRYQTTPTIMPGQILVGCPNLTAKEIYVCACETNGGNCTDCNSLENGYISKVCP